MPEPSDEPTVPIDPVPPSGLGLENQPRPTGWQQQAAGGGGAHRRVPDGAESDRRWPWVATLGVLAVLAVSGLIWMFGSLPQSGSLRQAAPTFAPTAQLSTPDVSVGTRPPPPAVSTAATATSTPATSPPASPTATATPSPTATPSRSPVAQVVRVPGVVGKRQSAATAALRSVGFSVVAVPVSTDVRRQINRVLSQSPAAGQTARRGSTVTIYVGVAASH